MYRIAMLTLLCSTLVSCASAPPPPLSMAEVAKDGYVLDSGDKLRITVYGETNLTGEYNVTSSGEVSFPLIGGVSVKGLTTDALAQALTAQLGAGYIKDPRVAVEVLNYRPYYIFGEVTRPGEYPFVNGRTIEQAIASAGGYTYRGNDKRVTLRRANEDNRLVLRNQLAAQVQPGDTIRVGERYF